MKVILHIGAHRCATTSFQYYLRHNAGRLRAQGIGVWGPRRTRRGLFSGIQPGFFSRMTGRDAAVRARGRIRLARAHARDAGLHTLLVTDENMIGALRTNFRMSGLYSGVGERIARFVEAFDGDISEVMLNIRSLEYYWASAGAYNLTRGRQGPHPRNLRRLARHDRSWRDVITDVACATEGARVRVFPFESFGGKPDHQLAGVIGHPVPKGQADVWLNRSPDTAQLAALHDRQDLPDGPGQRWMPFTAEECAALRRTYANDIKWLTSGADGLATLQTTSNLLRPGRTGPGDDMTRGTDDEYQDRRVAQAR